MNQFPWKSLTHRGRLLFALAAALLFGLFAQPTAALRAADFDHEHAQLDHVLKRRVDARARVDYRALKRDRKDLDAWLKAAAAVSRPDFDSWTKPQQLAFLVNLYNAGTLRLIVDNHPVASIKKIGNLFKGPWDQKVVRLFGETVTLGHIEHDLLRGNYSEPAIHFAIVCAAKGCPPLRAEAYTADKLSAQLDDQGRVFLGQRDKNRIDLANRTLHLSPIFKWFDEDFKRKSGTVQKFVTGYFPEGYHNRLNAGKFKIRYTDYDWSLNEAD